MTSCQCYQDLLTPQVSANQANLSVSHGLLPSQLNCPIFPIQFNKVQSLLSNQKSCQIPSSESPKNCVAHSQIVIINYPCTLVNRPSIDVMITSNLESNSSQMPGQTIWSTYPFWFHLSRQSSKTCLILKIVNLFWRSNSLHTISCASKPVSASNIQVCSICPHSTTHARQYYSQ